MSDNWDFNEIALPEPATRDGLDASLMHVYEDRLRFRNAMIRAYQAASDILQVQIDSFEREMDEISNPRLFSRSPFDTVRHERLAGLIGQLKIVIRYNNEHQRTNEESAFMIMVSLEKLYTTPTESSTS